MSAKPSAKTGLTGLAGAGAGAGLAPLIVWIALQFGLDVPWEVAVIVGGLIAAAASTVIAWLVPAKSGKYVDLEADRFDWDYERDGRMVDYATGPESEPATLTEEEGA